MNGGILLKYEINEETMAIMPLGYEKSKIIELTKELIVEDNPFSIMEENCEYYGSTYSGRIRAAQKILNFSYKLPLLIEESEKIIFFPTQSFTSDDCCWINHNFIKKREKLGPKTSITFINGNIIEFDISKLSFENQMLRAGMLEAIIAKRIKNSN